MITLTGGGKLQPLALKGVATVAKSVANLF